MVRLLIGTALAGVFAGALLMFSKPHQADVYAMPMATVYDKLTHASVTGGEHGVFHQGVPTMTGNGSDLVSWVGKATTCTFRLTPVDAQSTKIAASCNQSGVDAENADVSSWASGELRKRVIEAVDATLTGRPYNPDRAEEGITASNWPADTVDHASAMDVVDNHTKKLPDNMKQMEQAQQMSANVPDQPAPNDGPQNVDPPANDPQPAQNAQ